MPIKIPNDSLLDTPIADLVRGTHTTSPLLDSLIAELVRRRKEEQQQPAQIPLPQPQVLEGCPACGGPLGVYDNRIKCSCCGRSDD